MQCRPVNQNKQLCLFKKREEKSGLCARWVFFLFFTLARSKRNCVAEITDVNLSESNIEAQEEDKQKNRCGLLTL